MIDSTTTSRATSQAATSAAPAPPGMGEAPTLFTEQQVMFSTVAAVAPPVKSRRWTDAIGSVRGAVRAFFADSRAPADPHYPKRLEFLENSLMAREMNRL